MPFEPRLFRHPAVLNFSLVRVKLPDYWDHHPTAQYQAESTGFKKSATAVEAQEQLAEQIQPVSIAHLESSEF